MRARLRDPAGRVVVLARRAKRAFAVRMWRRFLRRNGILLSAGMAYQTLFALFAFLYVGFASAGVWIGASAPAVDTLIRVVDGYLPGIIGPHGIATAEQVRELAASATSSFTVTGLIAVAVALWSGIGAVTFTRRAVRGIFGLPFDTRSWVLLKLKDAAAAAAFGLMLLVGSAISVVGVWALTQLLDLFGLRVTSLTYDVLLRASSVIVVVAIDTAAIALLVRFLTGTALRWRRIGPGAAAGGAAVAAAQLGLGLLLAHTPGNPLLVAFAVVVALLLWCRLVAAVVLLSASWISVGAADRDEPIEADSADGRVGGPR